MLLTSMLHEERSADNYRFHKSIVLLQNTNKISFSLSDISLQSDKYNR